MHTSKRARILALSVAVTLVLALGCLAAACGGEQDAGATGDGGDATAVQSIKIGTLYPVTGELAKLGQECFNGLKLAIDEINAAGGIKSMGGAKIKLVEADSQGKPDVGIQEVERLASDGVSLICGTYQSSVAIPATQAAERLGVPFFVTMAAADEITERGYKYTFRISEPASTAAKDMIGFCADMEAVSPEYGPIETAVILHEDTDFGQSMAAGLKKYAAKAGIKIMESISYASSSPDLTTQVSRIKADKPDIVLMSTYLNDSILITQAREKLGITTLFFDASGGTIDPEFTKRLGESANDILTIMEFSKYFSDEANALNDAFKAAYGSEITGNGAYAYQSGYVIAKALENCASTDRDVVRDAIAAVKLDKAAGDHVVVLGNPITFESNGQATLTPLGVVQIEDGELLPVYPLDAAVTKLKFQK